MKSLLFETGLFLSSAQLDFITEQNPLFQGSCINPGTLFCKVIRRRKNNDFFLTECVHILLIYILIAFKYFDELLDSSHMNIDFCL